MRFGASWAIIGVCALLWPLILSLLVVNPTATIVFYALGLAGDCAVFVLWLRRALGYSKRARRGETFSIGRFAA
ncbi:MAG TPA: hypothetical protein VFA29_08400 [Candidatus Baltobacteraceae bacterium]|nr:hypothetical protein [Candidatus Baltobacteraceae bacterium]